jgi:aspartate/methionine/tyrosine aminotransferase
MLSNPCNPTGITKSGETLRALVEAASFGSLGLLVDEAYEMFHTPPVSALKYINNIDDSNFFITGAATKGLQAPGIRIGWVVAAKRHIEILGNFSSFGMGGVSRPSQLYALALLNKKRINLARKAIPEYYASQRDRYGQAFTDLGIELFSGNGGFYHWCKLPGNLTASELNDRLYQDGAAILQGKDCDMARLGKESPLKQFFRFSFGPLPQTTFEADIAIMRRALA